MLVRGSLQTQPAHFLMSSILQKSCFCSVYLSLSLALFLVYFGKLADKTHCSLSGRVGRARFSPRLPVVLASALHFGVAVHDRHVTVAFSACLVDDSRAVQVLSACLGADSHAVQVQLLVSEEES